MRSGLDATTLALYTSGVYDCHWRVRVANGSGTLQDLHTRCTGLHLNLPNPNAPVGTLKLDFVREGKGSTELTDSLAPLQQNSLRNRLNDGVTYSPLLQVGREVVVNVALTAVGGARPADAAVTWYEVFRGRVTDVDWPNWGSRQASIAAADLAGELQLVKTETAHTYAAGTSLEAAMQAVLTNNGYGSLSITTPVASGKVLSANYTPGLQKPLWSMLWEIAQSIGWLVWVRYTGQATRQIVFFSPARTKTVPDMVLPKLYDFQQLKVSQEEIRNVGYLQFTDLARVRQQVGPLEDLGSIAEYGGVRRTFWISLNEDSPVRTTADASSLLAEALSDVSSPDILATAHVPAPVFAEAAVDLYTIPAAGNERWLSADRETAPFAVSIDGRTDKEESTGSLQLRAAPSAGTRIWLGRKAGSFGPTLVVTATPSAASYSITWSGDDVQLSIDGGAFATPPASPIVVTRNDAGGAAKTYVFRGTKDGQSTTTTVSVPPITPDIFPVITLTTTESRLNAEVISVDVESHPQPLEWQYQIDTQNLGVGTPSAWASVATLPGELTIGRNLRNAKRLTVRARIIADPSVVTEQYADIAARLGAGDDLGGGIGKRGGEEDLGGGMVGPPRGKRVHVETWKSDGSTRMIGDGIVENAGLGSTVTESGGKAVNRLFAKPLSSDADNIDSVGDTGTTYKRTTQSEKTQISNPTQNLMAPGTVAEGTNGQVRDTTIATAGLLVGEVVSASAWIRGTVNADTWRLTMRFYTAANALISSVFGSSVTNTLTTPARIAVASGTIPATTSYIRLEMENVGAATGQRFGSKYMLNRGPIALPFEHPPLRPARETLDDLGDGGTYKRTVQTDIDDARAGRGNILNIPSNLLVNGNGQKDAIGAAPSSWSSNGGFGALVANSYGGITPLLGDRYIVIDNNSLTQSQQQAAPIITTAVDEVYELSGWIRVGAYTTAQGSIVMGLNADTGTLEALELQGAYTSTISTYAVAGAPVAAIQQGFWHFCRVVVRILTAGTMSVRISNGWNANSDADGHWSGLTLVRMAEKWGDTYRTIDGPGQLRQGTQVFDGTTYKSVPKGMIGPVSLRNGQVYTLPYVYGGSPVALFQGGPVVEQRDRWGTLTQADANSGNGTTGLVTLASLGNVLVRQMYTFEATTLALTARLRLFAKGSPTGRTAGSLGSTSSVGGDCGATTPISANVPAVDSLYYASGQLNCSGIIGRTGTATVALEYSANGGAYTELASATYDWTLADDGFGTGVDTVPFVISGSVGGVAGGDDSFRLKFKAKGGQSAFVEVAVAANWLSWTQDSTSKYASATPDGSLDAVPTFIMLNA
jgi:hypothetical protein